MTCLDIRRVLYGSLYRQVNYHFSDSSDGFTFYPNAHVEKIIKVSIMNKHSFYAFQFASTLIKLIFYDNSRKEKNVKLFFLKYIVFCICFFIVLYQIICIQKSHLSQLNAYFIIINLWSKKERNVIFLKCTNNLYLLISLYYINVIFTYKIIKV